MPIFLTDSTPKEERGHVQNVPELTSEHSTFDPDMWIDLTWFQCWAIS